MPSFQEEISVFDLPNLRNQPTFEVLQQTLQALEVKPKTWGLEHSEPNAALNEPAISRYLTRIISNLFEWFDDSEVGDVEKKKEILWDLASKRVTERCGRSAMGELNRTWTIPASKTLPELSFDIREPPLTGDNLGFKTWGTAYTISKRLENIGSQFLEDTLRGDARVLELGAGTGLVGIAAAAIWSTDVLLTDLEDIQNNLDFNIQQNIDVVASRRGNVCGRALDWKSSGGLSNYPCEHFEVVIAADSLYDDEHPSLVSNMIKTYLRQDSKSRALVAVPLRDKNTIRMAGELKKTLEKLGLAMCHEDWEICRDDWESPADDESVKCWWALFEWASEIS